MRLVVGMHVFGFAQALHTMAGGDEKIFKLLLRQVRCEGHQFHSSASICLTRAAVVNALYSSAIMLRTSDQALVMRSGIYYLVDHELDFDNSCICAPSEEDRAS